MKIGIKTALAALAISLLTFSCNKEASETNNDNYSVDITFDGLLRKCPQYGGAASNEGTLIGTCTFNGDNLSIGAGSSNLYDNSKSNGFNFSFNVGNVTHAGVYSFREETITNGFPNATALMQRFTSGPLSSASLTLDNVSNLQKEENASGDCISTNTIVGVQEIDITRFSNEVGGLIEGTFYATVYEKPNGCYNYIPHIITASFKVKRINL